MNVLVTGGTGLVGSHACRALMAAGHSVRLLVRSPDKARAFYGGLGETMPELLEGDITDVESVRRALDGCDAVVHAAAATPMQIDSVDRLFAVNVGGVQNVVGSALKQGIERIVYVSSITAIFNTDGSKVTPDAPPTPSKMPYGQSKVEAELYLRRLQADGAPIAILYPAGIAGPDDPGFSDTCKAIKYRIDNGFRIFGDGGTQYIDVRDLAALIRALVEDGGSGRFLVPGIFSSWTEQADFIEEVSGCRLQRIPASGWKFRLIGRLVDIVRKFRKVDSPISAETMRYATLWPRIENSDELARRGLSLRDPRETFADTLAWMVEAGHLEPSQCPKLSADTAGH
jgi:nucleoside-diphosphate-sugar epimerase